MSGRAVRRAKRGLEQRQAGHLLIPIDHRAGYRKPGSLNPRKSHAIKLGKRAKKR